MTQPTRPLVEKTEQCKDAPRAHKERFYQEEILPLGQEREGWVIMGGWYGWKDEQIAGVAGVQKQSVRGIFSRIQKFADGQKKERHSSYGTQIIPIAPSKEKPNRALIKQLTSKKNKTLAGNLLLTCLGTREIQSPPMRYVTDDFLQSLLDICSRNPGFLAQAQWKHIPDFFKASDIGAPGTAATLLLYCPYPEVRKKARTEAIERMRSLADRFGAYRRTSNTNMYSPIFQSPILPEEKAIVYKPGQNALLMSTRHENPVVQGTSIVDLTSQVRVLPQDKTFHAIKDHLLAVESVKREEDSNKWAAAQRTVPYALRFLGLLLENVRKPSSDKQRQKQGRAIRKAIKEKETANLLSTYVEQFAGLPHMRRIAERLQANVNALTA